MRARLAELLVRLVWLICVLAITFGVLWIVFWFEPAATRKILPITNQCVGPKYAQDVADLVYLSTLLISSAVLGRWYHRFKISRKKGSE